MDHSPHRQVTYRGHREGRPTLTPQRIQQIDRLIRKGFSTEEIRGTLHCGNRVISDRRKVVFPDWRSGARPTQRDQYAAVKPYVERALSLPIAEARGLMLRVNAALRGDIPWEGVA